MSTSPNDVDTLRLLARRAERLAEEYEHDAPTLIKLTELKLINEACLKLLDGLDDEVSKEKGQA